MPRPTTRLSDTITGALADASGHPGHPVEAVMAKVGATPFVHW
jgi:hypothetical protein